MKSNKDRCVDTDSRTRRSVAPIAVVVAALAVLMSAVMSPLAGAAEASDGPTAAAWAAAWIEVQMDANLPLEPFGSPDWGSTLDAALGLAALGGNDSRLAEIWAAVEADREGAVVLGGGDFPARLAQVILLATAIGEDPRAVGDGPGGDLVARLEASRTVGGADEGLFGAQSATYDGAYRQGYALAALVAAGETPDPTAVTWLLDQQCADGSWMPYRADLGEPCAFDGGLFVGPDSNSTAAAISGLTALGLAGGAEATAGLDWLDSVQAADGGWPFYPGDGSDPNSTSLVIQALVAAGLLDDPAFVDQDGTPLEALLAFQLGCDEGADAGAFTYPGSGGAPNLMATAQSISAAAGAPLGITGPVAIGPFEDPCESATTTTTTSSTTTSVPTTVTSAPGSTTSAAPTSTTGSDGSSVAGSGDAASQDAAPEALAVTGTAADLPALVGAVMLLVGAGALVGARRVRRD